MKLDKLLQHKATKRRTVLERKNEIFSTARSTVPLVRTATGCVKHVGDESDDPSAKRGRRREDPREQEMDIGSATRYECV